MPGDTKTHRARMARKAKRHAGTIEDLRVKLWNALERCEELIDDDEANVALRGIHALAQVAGPYLRAIEIGELEKRIAELEASSDAKPNYSR